MLVRSCFSDLLPLLLSKHSAVLLGTPGIGKSRFGLFVAWSHVVSCPSIPLVYQSQSGELVYLIHGGARIVGFGEVESLLNSIIPVLYVVDGCTPLASVCKTLLVSSPKKIIWSKWQARRVASVFFMPAFLLDELERCRKLCFPAVSALRLLQLFERWGGSVRFTLAHAAIDAQRTATMQLNSDLTSKDLSKMLEVVAAADCGGLEDASHRIIHMSVSPDYTEFSLVFASPYMCNRALVATVAREKGKVLAFMQAADNVRMLRALRGQLYQLFAVAALRAGGNFALVPLSRAATGVAGVTAAAAVPSDVQLPPRRRSVSYRQRRPAERLRHLQHCCPRSSKFSNVGRCCP
jgi:hypothetical protein